MTLTQAIERAKSALEERAFHTEHLRIPNSPSDNVLKMWETDLHLDTEALQTLREWKPDSVGDFPISLIRVVAEMSCHCQKTGPDVDLNAHHQSCMVGKCQKYLGQLVTDKPIYANSAPTGEGREE